MTDGRTTPIGSIPPNTWYRSGRRLLFSCLLLGSAPSFAAESAIADTTAYRTFKETFARNDRGGLEQLGAVLRTSGSAYGRELRVLAMAAAAFRADQMLACDVLLDSLLGSTKAPDPALSAVARKLKAMVQLWAGNHSAGLAEVDLGLAVADSIRHSHERVDLMVIRAELLNSSDATEDALLWLDRAQRLSDMVHYHRGLCLVRINFGNIRFAQESYDKAWDHYRETLDCATAHGFDMIAQNAVSNLGSAAVMMQRYDVAIHLFDSLLASLGRANPALRARIHGQMGFVHTRQNDHARALLNYSRALAISDSIGDRLRAAKVAQHLSSSEWDLGRRKEAIATLLRSLAIAQEMGLAGLEVEVRSTLWEWYEEMGDGATALDHAYHMVVLNDSLMKARFNERMALAEVRFDTEIKEHRIAEQDQALRLAEEEDRRKSMQRNLSLVMVGVLLLAAVLLWRSLHMRRKLAQRERELHRQQVDELMHQQEIKAINAMLEGQEKERDRVAKDLHDRLGSMLSAIKFQVGALEGQVQQVRADQTTQYSKVNRMLDEAVGEVRRISHDMIAVTLSRFGLGKALEDLCNTVRVRGRLAVELQVFGLEQRMDRSLEIVVYRMVQELVSNVLKHARASEISIDVTRSAGRLSVIVADDGVGFDTGMQPKGIGLSNVHDRAASLGARVQVDSTPGKGTTVSVECPIVE